jgi:hypothetical protein
MGLGAAILHCQYAEIIVNYVGLGASILHCQYSEILLNLTRLSAAFLYCQYSKICIHHRKTLKNSEGAIKNGQSRENGNIGYTRQRQAKQTHNKICVGHHYTQQTQIT